LGFEAAAVGGWFHKIGVGLLKKTTKPYAFHHQYEIRPAVFEVTKMPNKLIIRCQSEIVNGYGYVLKKIIELGESGFTIHYHLKNTGTNVIITDEYVHNFTVINAALIGNQYQLNFPFLLQPNLFEETVNPEGKVIISQKIIRFKGTPKKQFFFSNLSGNKLVPASWELIHHQHKIGISEKGNFVTNKVNLWGWEQVISPELFFTINLAPNQSTEWIRQYDVFKIK